MVGPACHIPYSRAVYSRQFLHRKLSIESLGRRCTGRCALATAFASFDPVCLHVPTCDQFSAQLSRCKSIHDFRRIELLFLEPAELNCCRTVCEYPPRVQAFTIM